MMPLSPATWQLTLAQIEGALPFIAPELAECLAITSLRRMWQVHVRDYPFDNLGVEHYAGPEAHELMRSWHAEERRQFLSWITRRAPSPLADAARLVLRAKRQTEGFSSAYQVADRALQRLDALLPTSSPFDTLLEWLEALRSEELDFLEGGSELVSAAGLPIVRPARRGAAWAASLAVALRPHLFGLGKSPAFLAGTMPRMLFRDQAEEPVGQMLRHALDHASSQARSDLMSLHGFISSGGQLLERLSASPATQRAWRIAVSLSPLTRAELARALERTKRTSSLATERLIEAGLVRLRHEDGALTLTASRP